MVDGGGSFLRNTQEEGFLVKICSYGVGVGMESCKVEKYTYQEIQQHYHYRLSFK